MSQRNRQSSKSKRIVVTAEDSVYIGLDVHKASVHAALRVNGGEAETWVMPMDVTAVVQSLARFRAGLKQIVYEAGPTGYGLVRALREAGLPAEVIAPGKTPQAANAGAKSDRLDCRKLAEFAEKGLLTSVAVPTEEEEADRQVLRLRDQLTSKRKRVKQQVKGLLLMYGVPEPEGLKNWTLAGIARLSELSLRAQVRFDLDCLVEELRHLTGLLNRAKAMLRRMGRQKTHQKQATRLKTHPGVGHTTAMAYLLEVYQPGRFKDERALVKYLGLAPRVSRTGKTTRSGPLMKAGRGTLRALLVEAAWRWIAKDARAKAAFERIKGNTGKSQVAIVAMARKMAINLWYMLIRDEDYRQAA